LKHANLGAHWHNHRLPSSTQAHLEENRVVCKTGRAPSAWSPRGRLLSDDGQLLSDACLAALAVCVIHVAVRADVPWPGRVAVDAPSEIHVLVRPVVLDRPFSTSSTVIFRLQESHCVHLGLQHSLHQALWLALVRFFHIPSEYAAFGRRCRCTSPILPRAALTLERNSPSYKVSRVLFAETSALASATSVLAEDMPPTQCHN
jgi:hypothetical protein